MPSFAARNAVEKYEVTSVDRSEVLRYMGYSGQPMTPELDARIDGVVERCLRIARPMASWDVFDVAGRGALDDGRPATQLTGTSMQLIGEIMG